ncbi:HepT-like ribonuclease domain-containing protein [Crocosphaera chwakensis]|uniref:Nucleotidyltransferase n=1 Tax=Crocosphaera chwakensis CCY0110 TaxID=391612 RepID=A3IR33_9CHRO|nr:HepT-like ribonuclease domain-containing protein [Crocosphaera chwakensis]EAZ91023.1 nucleotidyltransferase [Crocosphaera chwakensis CCY0110]
MRDDRERLQDILDAINQIEKYAAQGQDKFMEDELIQTWVVHHLMIIGEASSKMSQETKERYTDIPWVGTIDVRNIIAHEYFRVDFDIIWIIIRDNLPDLKKKIEDIL